MRCCCCWCCYSLRDRILSWLRDYDRLQSLTVILIYIQIGSALIGSLGASYNGVLLINSAIALFALVTIENSSQSLGRPYVVLLFFSLFLDVSWFILFSYEIWHICSDFGVFFIFSVRLALAMQIVGFSVRLSSSFLWVQIYRLGTGYVDNNGPRDADFGLRNSFLSPTTPSIARQSSGNDEALVGAMYDPAYYSSLFAEGQNATNSFVGHHNDAIGNSGSPSGVDASQLRSLAGRSQAIDVCSANFTLATPTSMGSYPEKPNYLSTSEKEIQSTQQSKPSLYQGSSISQMPSLSKKSADIPNSNTKRTVSTIGGVKHAPTATNHSLSDSSKNLDSQLPLAVAVSISTGPSTKVLQFNVPISKSQPSEKVSQSASAFSVPVSAPSSSMFSSPETLSSLSVPSFTTSTSSFMTSISKSVLASSSSAITSSTTSTSLFSIPSTVPTSLSSMQFSNPTTSSTVAIDVRQTVSSTSSPTPVFSSSSSFSINPSKTLVPSSPLSSSVISNSESSKTNVQPSVNSSAISKSKTPKTEARSPIDALTLKRAGDATAPAPPPKPYSSAGEFSQKPESAVLPTIETPTLVSTGSQQSVTNILSRASDVTLNPRQGPPSSGSDLFPALMSTTISTSGEDLDVIGTEEDKMEEEAPEAIQRPEPSLGNFGGFGIGSAPNLAAPKSNPFGAAFGNAATSLASPSFTMAVPSGGQLFGPASFNFSSPWPSQPSQPTRFGSFSGGFGAPTAAQALTPSGFGQPAQLGAGQQALGSVLGTFGQARRIGDGLPGIGFASASGFVGSFASTPSTGGFSNAATGGGFVGGGFASIYGFPRRCVCRFGFPRWWICWCSFYSWGLCCYCLSWGWFCWSCWQWWWWWFCRSCLSWWWFCCFWKPTRNRWFLCLWRKWQTS